MKMPSFAVATPFPVSPAPARVFARLRERLESVADRMFATALSPEQALYQGLIGAVTAFVENHLEPENKKRTTGFTFTLAKTHREAAEKAAEGYEFPTKRYDTREKFINFNVKRPKKGTYDKNFSRVIINIQAIREAHEGDRNAQRACVVATSIHETLHHVSGMERHHRRGQHRFDILWFIEGTNEIITRRVMATSFPEDAKNLTCESCYDVVPLVEKISAIIGEDVLFRAYLNGQFYPILTALGKAGVTDEEIQTMLQLGHQMMNSRGAKKEAAYTKLSNHLDTLRRNKDAWDFIKNSSKQPDIVDTGEQGSSDENQAVSAFYEKVCWYTTKALMEEADYDPHTPLLGLKINYGINSPAGERIFYDVKADIAVLQMGNLRAGHNTEEATAMAIYQTMVAACHHNGSFGNYRGMNLEWLRVGFASQFAREKMKKWYPDREAMLKEHTLVEQVSEVMTGLAGQEVMKKAFLTKTVKPIADALQGKGVGNEALAAFLESGCDAAVKGEFDNLLCLAKQFSRKINRIDKLDNAEIEAGAQYYGRVFGPLGREAAPRMIGLRNSDASLLYESARAQAVRLNLLADSSAPLPENMAGQLTNRFSGRTTFDATNIENMSSAYLKLLDHAEGEAPLFVENKALEFEAHYGVRPTVRQLMHYLADSIVYQLSEHQSSVLDALAGSSANLQLVEQNVKSIPSEIASKLYKGIYSETVFSCSGISDYAGKAGDITAMATEYIQTEFGILKPTVTDVTAILALAKANAAGTGGEEVLVTLRGWVETGWHPPMAAASLLAEARVKAPDKKAAEAYLAKHPIGKEPDGEDMFRWLVGPSKADVLVSLCGHINYAYPSCTLVLDDGAGLQISDEMNRRFLPLASRDAHQSFIGKFSPYAGNTLHRLVKEHGLPGSIDPLRTGRRIKMAVGAIKKKAAAELKTQLQGRMPLVSLNQLRNVSVFATLIDEYLEGGTAGIKFDTDSHRPNGCLDSEEVLERGYALCLEHTLLFISLTRELGYLKRTLGFKVFADSHGRLIPHVCGGLLGGDGDAEHVSLEKSIETMQLTQLPFVFHHLFEMDPEFRRKVLEVSGYEGKNPHLILIDLSNGIVGAQYQTLVPMTELALLSAYLTDAGTYYIKNDKVGEAVGHFQTALRINPADELARSHLVSYYSDIEPCPEKAIELTDEPQRIVNPEDFLGRALALMITGRPEEAIIAALRALQLSENFEKARFFLDAVGFHRTEPQDNVISR
jgi:hypothetical protein